MSTMAAQTDYYEDEETPQREEAPPSKLRAAAEKYLLAKEAAIVPADSISGRALMAVIAIMTFLAALTLGATVLVRSAAGEWQSAVAREVTIQIRPSEQRDVEADVRNASALASGTAGVAGVRAYSKEESASLLEPWIGSGLALNDLPIPRMIVVRVAPGETPDFASLRQKLASQVPGATLDDHRGWIDRMRAMARNAALAGLAVLALVFAATTWWQAVPLAISLALAIAGIGFAIQHDANHGSYSSKESVNRLMGITLDLLGASSYVWKWKHNIFHHTYTNLSGSDEDINIGFFARLSPVQPRRRIHRLQQFYV